MQILRTAVFRLATVGMTLAALAPFIHGADGAVYTMTNAAQDNEVLIFERNPLNGTLSFDAAVETGGNGNGGSLGNQGAVVLTEDERWLLVVNAGSNSISSLRVGENGLQLVDTAQTGGKKPVSIAVHDDYVAVLNAGGDVGTHDSVTLLLLAEDGELIRLPFEMRLSELSTSPAQVGFAQEGQVLVVTEKETNRIVTFPLRKVGPPFGPVVHESAGNEPFGFALAKRDQLLVTEAATGAVTSYRVARDGTLTVLDTESTTEAATCWAVALPGARIVYVTNSASGTVSSLAVDFDGSLDLLDDNGVAATTGAGPIDAALSPDGHFLYVLASGTDAINVFRVAQDGTLDSVETQSGVMNGANGLAAR